MRYRVTIEFTIEDSFTQPATPLVNALSDGVVAAISALEPIGRDPQNIQCRLMPVKEAA
jgi:hypothetical protein